MAWVCAGGQGRGRAVGSGGGERASVTVAAELHHAHRCAEAASRTAAQTGTAEPSVRRGGGGGGGAGDRPVVQRWPNTDGSCAHDLLVCVFGSFSSVAFQSACLRASPLAWYCGFRVSRSLLVRLLVCLRLPVGAYRAYSMLLSPAPCAPMTTAAAAKSRTVSTNAAAPAHVAPQCKRCKPRGECERQSRCNTRTAHRSEHHRTRL